MYYQTESEARLLANSAISFRAAGYGTTQANVLTYVPQVRVTQQTQREDLNDREQTWIVMTTELDKKLKNMEEALMSTVRYMYGAMWQNSLVNIEGKRCEIHKVMKEKLTRLIQQKIQVMEGQICQMVEEKLQAMEEKIKRAERQIANGRGNAEIPAVTATEQSQSSGSNTETDFCSGAMVKIGEMDARLAVLEAAVKKTVVNLFPKLDVMLKELVN